MFNKLLCSLYMVSLLVSACTAGGGDSGDDGSGDDDGGPGSGGNVALPKDLPSPATPALWRLTERQYQNALRDLFGSDITIPQGPSEQSAGGLAAIAAGTTTASGQDVERYEQVATSLVGTVFGDKSARRQLVACGAESQVDTACLRSFFADFGHRAFRRPLTTSELDRFVNLASSSAAVAEDAWVGVQTAVAALLQSPKFLYRFESGSPDPKNNNRNVLSAHERASRLAFLLWDSIPDQELLDAAEAGDLMSAAGMRTQARRLWVDARTRSMWRGFVEENYRLSDLSRSAAEVSPELLLSMQNEVLQLAESVVFDDKSSFYTFFTSDKAYVDPLLRAHYGLPQGESGFALAEFPQEQERMGFFGSAAFLTLTSTSLHTSPTSRGKFLRERILCEDVPAPMAGVNTALPPASAEARTTRERLDAHRQDPACASCHNFMDPPGYAFERLDQVGKHRDTENGADIRTDGVLELGDKEESFSGPRELLSVLVKQEGTAACLARGLLRHATGYVETRVEPDVDERLVAGLATLLKDRGFQVEAFLTEFVASDAFVTRQNGDL